jgi:hypothetical protein
MIGLSLALGRGSGPGGFAGQRLRGARGGAGRSRIEPSGTTPVRRRSVVSDGLGAAPTFHVNAEADRGVSGHLLPGPAALHQQIEMSPSSPTARRSENRRLAITPAVSSRCFCDRSAQPLLGRDFDWRALDARPRTKSSPAECPEDALICLRRVGIVGEGGLILVRSRDNRQQLGKR